MYNPTHFDCRPDRDSFLLICFAMPDLPADGSQAEGASDDGDSLDRDLTQAHSLGDAGGPDAGAQQGDSLDRGQTLGRSGSSSSDISQFDEGWEQTEQAKGLDTRYAIEGPIGHGGMGGSVSRP